jgi:hypothetical protein
VHVALSTFALFFMPPFCKGQTRKVDLVAKIEVIVDKKFQVTTPCYMKLVKWVTNGKKQPIMPHTMQTYTFSFFTAT